MPTTQGEHMSVASITRVVLRPVGSSLPVGFLGLAVGTISLAGLELGWVPMREHTTVSLVLIAFVFPIQIISSVFGFLARDTVAGTGMAVLAGTWLTIGTVTHGAYHPAGDRALALFLFVAATAMISPACAATTGKLIPAAIMALAGVRFAMTGLSQWFGATAWAHASGWEGVALAGLAVYGAIGLELEDTLRRRFLPMGRRGAGRRALDGGIMEQLDLVEREAGVREQL